MYFQKDICRQISLLRRLVNSIPISFKFPAAYCPWIPAACATWVNDLVWLWFPFFVPSFILIKDTVCTMAIKVSRFLSFFASFPNSTKSSRLFLKKSILFKIYKISQVKQSKVCAKVQFSKCNARKHSNPTPQKLFWLCFTQPKYKFVPNKFCWPIGW